MISKQIPFPLYAGTGDRGMPSRARLPAQTVMILNTRHRWENQAPAEPHVEHDLAVP